MERDWKETKGKIYGIRFHAMICDSSRHKGLERNLRGPGKELKRTGKGIRKDLERTWKGTKNELGMNWKEA